MLPGPILFRVVTAAALLWVVGRVAIFLLGCVWILQEGLSLIPGALKDLLVLSPLGAATFTGLLVAMTWIDIRTTHEQLLYGNLGIRPLHVSLIVVAVAAVLEGTMAIVVGAALGLATGSP